MEQNLEKLQKDIRGWYEIPEMSLTQVERLKWNMERAKRDNRRARLYRMGLRTTAAVASVVIGLFVLANTSRTVAMAMQQIPLLGEFVQLITVRDYQYEDNWHAADITVGELVLEDISGIEDLDAEVQAELENTLASINAQMQEITEELQYSFEMTVENEEGPLSTVAKAELVPSTERYVVVKLNCFLASGSGIEWKYYYTIDLTTGKQITLADLFVEGADYVTPISENIITQMRQQMTEDPDKSFDIDSKEGDSVDVAQVLRERQAFYVNENGNVVIGFDEGEVAAMYMGALEFEIDNEAILDIRK